MYENQLYMYIESEGTIHVSATGNQEVGPVVTCQKEKNVFLFIWQQL